MVVKAFKLIQRISDLKFLNEDERRRLEEVCSSVVIPKQINKFHTVISKANIDISKDVYDRGKRILDTLIGALEDLGYTINAGGKKNYFFVKIHGEKIGFKLKEHFNQINHIPTPEEIKRKEKDQFYRILPYDYTPKGELGLILDDYCAKQKNWNDGKNKKVEDYLGEFIIALIKTAEDSMIRKEAFEAADKRREEEKEIRQRQEELQRKELGKFKELEETAMDWHKARIIRDFIAAIEADLDKNEKSKKVTEWIKWAKEKADWFDPLVSKNDEILGVKNNYLNDNYEED
ncbi:MAG TPA: hypothetical protein DDW50_20890 [Firmicutes bacterium]|jgi:hypothetical protein|nr:hypothetical protein [Bacillota bacterium]